MNVLVDTSIWSLALRRARASAPVSVAELAELVREGRVVTIGPIRQEILSGVKSNDQFASLRDHFRAFPDAALETADYELAADFFNRCRAKGIQGSNTDFLMCAVASRLRLSIFTADDDFQAYQRVLQLELHEPRT